MHTCKQLIALAVNIEKGENEIIRSIRASVRVRAFSDLLPSILQGGACIMHTSSYWDSQKTIDTIRFSFLDWFNADNIK